MSFLAKKSVLVCRLLPTHARSVVLSERTRTGSHCMEDQWMLIEQKKKLGRVKVVNESFPNLVSINF